MKLFWKILAIAIVLALLFASAYGLFGAYFETLLDPQRCARWFAETRGFAWAIAIFLLVFDLLLPIPATGIMAALGSVYGVWWGGVISVIGSAGSGVLGFILARYGGRRLLESLASEEERGRFADFFERWGGYAIIISRALPILPEVLSILAGLATMGFSRFLAALLLGAIPVSFLFATIGSISQAAPVYGLLLAVFLPLLIWPFFLKMAVLRSPRTR